MSAPLYLPAWKLYGAWPAAATDHRPHRGYPRTDQTRRIIYTRRRGGEGAWPNFPSMTFEGDGAGGGRENLFPSRSAKPRPPRLSFVTIRYLFISRREENDLIYIYFSWRSRKHSWTFSVWKVFCRGEGEECRSRSGEETGNPLIRFLDSLLVESGCRYPRLWPTHEIRHAWPSCFRAPQFRRRTRPVSRENLSSRCEYEGKRRIKARRSFSRAVVRSSRWSLRWEREMEGRLREETIFVNFLTGAEKSANRKSRRNTDGMEISEGCVGKVSFSKAR